LLEDSLGASRPDSLGASRPDRLRASRPDSLRASRPDSLRASRPDSLRVSRPRQPAGFAPQTAYGFRAPDSLRVSRPDSLRVSRPSSFLETSQFTSTASHLLSPPFYGDIHPSLFYRVAPRAGVRARECVGVNCLRSLLPRNEILASLPPRPCPRVGRNAMTMPIGGRKGIETARRLL
jgi:hypothetical protein